jgi:hypothetical protein
MRVTLASVRYSPVVVEDTPSNKKLFSAGSNVMPLL